jgi:hypothetical protein
MVTKLLSSDEIWFTVSLLVMLMLPVSIAATLLML